MSDGAKDQGHAGEETCIIAVGNQKGGVGKTTTTVHLAAALGEAGRRCLIIDLDMNQGATRHFGIPSESFLGAFEVLIGDEQPEDVILTNDDGVELPPNVHLIAARRNLEKIDQALLGINKFVITQDVLLRPLRSLAGEYDYIFLDTAPNATTPTIAAYKAAHYFLLAAMPDPFAVAGLNDALTDIQGAQQNGNPNLRLLGVVLSAVDGRRTRLATTLIGYVERQFAVGGLNSAKFQTTVSRSTVVPEAQKVGKTLFQTAPTHKVCDQYRALARELETRLGRGRGGEVPEDGRVQQGAEDQTGEAVGNG
jgi:chromosome partitioning protein